MQKILCVLVLLVTYLSSFSTDKKDTSSLNLRAGIYDHGNNTYTLRWATNDKTLNTAPRVLGIGSSTLAGYLLTYPDRLGDKIATWLSSNTSNPVWINLAVGGYSSTNLMPTADGGNAGTNIDSAINSNPDFIFISLPTNDVGNGLSNIQILHNFRKLDTIALNKGIPVFWETTQPRNTYTTAQQTQLKVLADSIRAVWPQRYVEGFSNTVEVPATTDALIKTGYGAGDGVHLNTSGNQQIADSLFARWKSYFQPITGVAGYIIETSTDGITWSQLDAVTDPTLVKKTYTNTATTVSYYRVKAQYTDLTFSAYSNIVTLFSSDTTTVPVNRGGTANRILVDFGGDGINTVLPNGTAQGQPTASPDVNGNYWNNWYGSGGAAGFRDGATLRNLIATNDSTSGITMKIIGQPDGTYNTSATTRGINFNGFTTSVRDYPVTALSDNMFLHNSINPNGVILHINGLTRTKTYRFKLWGARVDNATTPRILETRLGSQTWTNAKTVETRYTTSDVPNYDRAIIYDSISGIDSLDIYMRVGTGSTFASLSLLDINMTNNLTIDTLPLCEGTSVSLTSKLTSTSYQWQLDAGKGYSDIANATSRTFSLNNILIASSGYHYRCKLVNDTSQVYYIIVRSSPTPSLAITTPAFTGCTGQSFTFTATAKGGDSLSYQWLVNNIATSVSNPFTTTQLTNGATIQAVVTSYSTCGNKTASSNIITVALDNTVTPTITISGTLTVPQATNVKMHAVATYTGTGPLYQWMDSTSTHAWRNITDGTDTVLSYIAGKTGDRIRCKLISNAGCTSAPIVYSTPLTFTVSLITAVNPDPVSQYGIRLYPNPVSTVLKLEPLKITDKWETLEIRSMDGKQQYLTKGIRNQTNISVPVTQLEGGTYVLVLRSTGGNVATIKFLKL